MRKLGLFAVENSVCKIEDVSILSFVTAGELCTNCKDFASALAPSVIVTICPSMTNCRDIGRQKFQCLADPAGVEKVENRKGLDDIDCSSMTPSKRGVTRTLAIDLQKELTFVDSTFGANITNIVSVYVKHVDVSNNSCEVKPGTSVEVGSGCMEVDRGKGESSSAVPVVPL